MRLSRPRLLLRATLLLVLAGFMAWRAVGTARTASTPGIDAREATTLSRIAVVEWALSGLALLTASAALLSLRKKPRAHSLHLDGAPPGGAGAGGPPPDPGAR